MPLGLDLRGGLNLLYQVDMSSAVQGALTPQQIRERQDYAIQQNITTLRNRVSARRVRRAGGHEYLWLI
jgi:preprotein translocase subunit SecD